MQITLIAAVNNKGVIGANGGIPWHIPEDFAFFKKATQGCPCIMGRKTFDSLPGVLPGRLNIVVTSNPDKVSVREGNVVTRQTVEDALPIAIKYAKNNNSGRIIVMGGETIYREFMPLAHELLITRVDNNAEGDVFFPEIDTTTWTLTEVMPLTKVASVERYERQMVKTLASIILR